jgi:hypothetical protein
MRWSVPLSVSALYAIHDMTDEEVSPCLEDHSTRSSLTVTDKIQFPKKSKKPALLKGEDAHVLMVSKLSDIAK